MTSKLQVTLPKALATQNRINPGDEILWVAAGDSIRIVPARSAPRDVAVKDRLRLFDQATRRQMQRQAGKGRVKPASGRGWSREKLYDRGRAR